MGNLTAETIYDAKIKLIEQEIEKLKEAVQFHNKEFQESGKKNFGYIGDLEYVRELLSQATIHLTLGQ